MSIALPPLDVSTLTVGQSATVAGIPLSNAETVKALGKPHLAYYNDSGCGFQSVVQPGNSSFAMPAGAWGSIELQPADIQVVLTAIYVIPNAPVSKVLVTYFYPGENVSSSSKLGNSPIGITGSVAVSSVSTLSNEGNSTNTLVIDIGPSGLSAIVSIWTDHFSWSVDQAGISHTVLQGQASGTPLLLGQSGDLAEALGNFKVDGTLTVTGDATFNGAGTGVSVANNLSVTGNTLAGAMVNPGTGNTWASISGTTSATEATRIQAGNQIRLQVPQGTDIADVGTNGITLVNGNNLTFLAGSISRFTGFSGTGSGTFNTNLGAVPNQLAFNPCTVSGSSQTIGGTNAQSSVVTTGFGLAWGGIAFKDVG